ncbi:hypothetical protein [Marinomonas sp.]|uniref:hypothetical protein n=1 Tax=Marinomonas sp. TaxID=1904862 RepID=UPI003A9356AA
MTTPIKSQLISPFIEEKQTGFLVIKLRSRKLKHGPDESFQFISLRVGKDCFWIALLPDFALAHEDNSAADIAGEVHFMGHQH